MSDADQQKGKFEPKQPVELAPPKDDVISLEHLSKCDGKPLYTRFYTAFTTERVLILTVQAPMMDFQPM